MGMDVKFSSGTPRRIYARTVLKFREKVCLNKVFIFDFVRFIGSYIDIIILVP